MGKYRIIIFIVLAFSSVAFPQGVPSVSEDRGTIQNSNTIASDTSIITDNTFFDLFTRKPGKAAFYGLIILGGGQIYNKKWWKLPLVYGLEGYLVYSIITNTQSYNMYQNALNDTQVENIGTMAVKILRNKRDEFRKAREYSWVFFIAGHLVIIFEAFIDRHLMEFDISDDLTFTPILTDIGALNGITYAIPLNKKKEYTFKNLLE